MQEKKTTVNGRILKEQEEHRYQKLLKLEAENYDVYGRKWERNYDSNSLQSKFADQSKLDLETISEKAQNDQIKIAGRLKLKRPMGKTIFATIQDQNGNFQVFLNVKNLTPSEFNLFNEYADYGDFFGFHGKIMKTKTGELTVKVFHLVMLSKALRPLPEKWHGISDVEERYRRRYLDLVMNDESKTVFIKRTKVLQTLREFLNNKGYLEVETPILQHVYGGAAAKPFVTFHNTLNSSLYLRIATELHLKRLIVGGFEGVYEIGRLFRNEGMSPRHNPEFTTVEVYVAYQDMEFMLNLTENCIKYIIEKINGNLQLEYKMNNQAGQTVEIKLDFQKPWKRITMIESLLQLTDSEFVEQFKPISELINQYETCSDETIIANKKNQALKLSLAIADKYQIKIDQHHKTVGHLLNLFFEHFVENTLIQPTFIYHYPVEISPLAKLSQNSKNFTDRFELFIGGREYANAYSELNNPIQQFQRFQEQMAEKAAGNEEATAEIDQDYVEALEYGMPPTAGLGIGIDRLVMLITGQDSIKDVLLFPHLKKK